MGSAPDSTAGLTQYAGDLCERIRSRLSLGPCSLLELVRSCAGAYPSAVVDCLRQMESEVARIDSSVLCLVSDTSLACEERLVTSALEGNPVLGSWYFTVQTCRRLASLRDWSDTRIAFLGAPRLYEWFRSHDLGKNRLLIDLDSSVLQALADLGKSAKDTIVQHDLSHKMPVEYEGQFDCAFSDPPWYMHEYCAWIKRATEVAPQGWMFIPLLPALTRPTAKIERDHLIARLIEISTSLTILSEFVDYEVPTFEQAQLELVGLGDLGAWRVADLVLSKIDPTAETEPWHKETEPEFAPSDWIESDVGQVRLFIRNNPVAEDGPVLVRSTDHQTGILPSPSRRTNQIGAANVLTSRGHALVTSSPKRLIAILEKMQNARLRGVCVEKALKDVELDSETREILTRILKEEKWQT